MESENINSVGYNLTAEDIEYYRKVKRKRIVSVILKVLVYAALTLWAVVAIFPIAWTAMSSFKDRGLVILDPFALPNSQSFTMENYKNIFTTSFNIFTGYMWSILISGLVVVIAIVIAVLAAFTMARYKFRFKTVVYTLIVGSMMFPAFSLIVPIVRILNGMKLMNSPIGVVLPQVALNLGFTITLLIGFFQSLPIEVEESAYMDGAGVVRVLFQIVTPMAKSAIVTCVIFIFLWSYNDLFMQKIIITSPKLYPISLLLNSLNTQALGLDYGKMAAASTLVCIPVIIVYCIFQRHIIKGLTAGAVKG